MKGTGSKQGRREVEVKKKEIEKKTKRRDEKGKSEK